MTDDWRASAIGALQRLGEPIAGPDVPGLMDFIEEACTAFHVPVPAISPSLNDFVPAHLRATFDAREEECQLALRKLIKTAQSAVALIKLPSELSTCEVDPFTGALMRHQGSARQIGDEEITRITAAIRVLADLQTNPEHAEPRGRRPINDLARIVVRATIYYRAWHDLPLDVNFDYLRHPAEGKGKRSRPGEISPRTPAARLAYEAVHLFTAGTDVPAVKTHLDNYRNELKVLDRKPLKGDFLFEFEWYAH